MKEIPLTQGKVALVDDEDYSELSKYKWYAHKNCNTWYAERRSSKINGKQGLIKMHVAVAGTPKGMETDHVNGNGLDNRRENLHAVTHRENLQNLHNPRTSKYPGVSWKKQHRKWRAQIQVNGKNHHLGYYDKEEAAYRRYQIACDWQVMEIEVSE
jgi:hypothetical protein